LAGAVFNAAWTLRQKNVYDEFGRSSPVPMCRWFFRCVVSKHPRFWTALLVIGETALGLLTPARGTWGRLGLGGSALWSALLFPLLWPYTLMMGPYALALAWLARRSATEHDS
jgi:hypothetical protein